MIAVNRSQRRSRPHWRSPLRSRIAQACSATGSTRQVSIPSLPTTSGDAQTASVVYKHNALGQRVFKSEPQGDGSGPDPAVLGADFAAWLKKNFGWLYAAGQADASVGTAYAYADESSGIPSWALMGEYDNGSTSGKGRTEYIWLPVQSEASPLAIGPQSQSLAGAIPVGFIRNSRLYAIHTDHLGTPRLVTDDDGKPIWQWLLRQAQDRQYSAFGDNAPTGVLKVTTNAASAITNQPVQLRATTPQEFNLRFPGQYFDSETKLAYNYFRNYQANTGRYTQSDPIGLDGGWNRFGYVDANPLGLLDPLGLWAASDLPSLPQPAVDFGAGLGDALLLGTGIQVRQWLDVDCGVNVCSESYGIGTVVAVIGSSAGLAYAATAKAMTLLATSGAQASAYRASLKTYFRLGVGKNWRPPNLANKTDAQLRASAGKTNAGMNAYAAGSGTVFVLVACECPK